MGFEIAPKRGVANHYGPRETDGQYGGQDNSVGKIKEASWTFDFDKLPAQGASNLEMQIPANATVLHAHLRILEGATSAGTANMEVGLTAVDGTGADPNALLTTSNATFALVQVKGNRIAGTGAVVTKTVGTKAVEVTVTSAATLTAGKFELVVAYQYN